MASFSTQKKRVNPGAPPKPTFLKRLLATKTAKPRTIQNIERYSDFWYNGGIKKPDITNEQKGREKMSLSDEGNEEDEEHVIAAVADDD